MKKKRTASHHISPVRLASTAYHSILLSYIKKFRTVGLKKGDGTWVDFGTLQATVFELSPSEFKVRKQDDDRLLHASAWPLRGRRFPLSLKVGNK